MPTRKECQTQTPKMQLAETQKHKKKHPEIRPNGHQRCLNWVTNPSEHVSSQMNQQCQLQKAIFNKRFPRISWNFLGKIPGNSWTDDCFRNCQGVKFLAEQPVIKFPVRRLIRFRYAIDCRQCLLRLAQEFLSWEIWEKWRPLERIENSWFGPTLLKRHHENFESFELIWWVDHRVWIKVSYEQKTEKNEEINRKIHH